MKLTNKLMTGVATAAIAMTSALPALAAEKWDMPMAYSASNFHSENGMAFAKCVTDGTAGEIEITVHPGGSLIAGADIKRAIQTGQVQLGERLLSGHQNENALFGFDSIPFLAPSFDDSDKLWKAAKPKIEELLAEQNLTLLYNVPWPPQGLYFKKDVNSVEDTTGYDQKVWESLTNFYEVDAWLPRNYVMVNNDVWSDVSDANKDIITTCATEAEARGLQASKDYTEFTYDGLREGGMKVEPASEELMTGLRAVGDTMTSEWLESSGDDGQTIVDGYKSMQ